MRQMYFDRVNEEFLTNLSKNPNLYTIKKHLTYEIFQRKFNRVKGALLMYIRLRFSLSQSSQIQLMQIEIYC